MAAIIESDLFTHCAHGLLREDGGLGGAGSFLQSFSATERNEVSRALADFLSAEGESGGVTARPIRRPSGADDQDFKSVVYRRQEQGATQELALFQVKDAALETWLPVIGVAIATLSGNFVGATVASTDIARKLWGNFRMFQRPADADAIDVIEALVKHKAQSKAEGTSMPPSTEALAGIFPEWEQSRLHDALEKLTRLKAIAAVEWGGQALDLKHPSNRWAIRI